MAAKDVDGEIREGVLAAVLYVASVSEPSTQELAREFVAANDEVVNNALRITHFAQLERAFTPGLSLDRLKRMAQERHSPSELLDTMCRGAQLVQGTSDGLAGAEEYRKLVVGVVERAVGPDLSDALPTRRPTYAQRVAIEKIRSTLHQPTTATAGTSHL